MTTKTINANETVSELDNSAIGDGATMCGYSDRQASTIIARTATQITVQRDEATLLNGPGSGEPDALTVTPGGFAAHTSGTQRWSTKPDANGAIVKYSRRVLETGKVIWKQVGVATRTPGFVLIEGRHEHYDFNF